jgi:hypothetical protein
MKGPLEYEGQYRCTLSPFLYPSLCPYIHGEKTPTSEKTPPARRPHREDPTMTLPKVHPTMTLCPYIHGEKQAKVPE